MAIDNLQVELQNIRHKEQHRLISNKGNKQIRDGNIKVIDITILVT